MPKKVLLAEDDQMIRTMYETKLKQDGFDVVAADNGATALDLAVQTKPDIILLDVIMPQMDGFAVLQELRLNSGTKSTPVLMLTNLGTIEDQEKGQQMGATGYLVKADLTPAQVSQAVKEQLK